MATEDICTIVVLGAKGGVGKSTFAVNLAAALALAGESVVLADADPQGGASLHLGTVIAPEELAPVTEIVSHGRDPHDVLSSTCVETLRLIAANKTLAGFENAESGEDMVWRLAPLRQLVDVASWIVIDTPPGVGKLPLMASVAADLAIVVTTYDDLGVLPLQDTVGTVVGTARMLNEQLELYGVVGSRFDPRTLVARAYRNLVADVLYPGQVIAELPERTRVREAQQAHVPLAVHLARRPRDQAMDVVKELERLAGVLIEHVGAKERDRG